MWIKCSDRLPPEGEFVLCAVDGKIWVACMVDNYDGGYEFCEPLDFCNIGPVTHWMPLPELPKDCELCCGNCKHFYYSEMVQGGSCWGEANAAKKRNADDKICELFIFNK